MVPQAQATAREREQTPLTGDEARRRLLATLPVTESRLELAGVSTAVLQGGDGPPVILLHGPSGYAAHWMGVIPGLATGHRVIAPDLPGHGASQRIDGPLDADRVLTWLGALIERTCAEPPVVVGQLLGGAIAARFAAANPDRISRLVLVDTFGLGRFQPAPEFGQALAAFQAEPTAGNHHTLWDQCAFDRDGLVARMGERWPPFEAYNIDRARDPGGRSALHALVEQFALPAIAAAELARIAAPTALIWGRHDRATPLAVAEAASARFGWPLQVIEDCADDPPVEQPEALLRALHGILAGDEPLGRGPARATDQQETRAAWNGIATGYDKAVTPTHLWLGNEGLRRAGLRAGLRFLDVAAGSGALSIPAAQLGAEVLATDLSPVMLGLLEERARREGLTVATRVMDGHALDLDDDSFDIVGSQFGVMLFPDMPKGVREMARVAKRGGRVLMSVYGDPRQIGFLDIFVRAIRSVRPGFDGPPLDPPPLPFQLQDPDRLRRELVGAGLRDVTVETITETLQFPTGAQLWEWLISSNPFAEFLLSGLEVTEAERHAIERALEALVRAHADGDGVAGLSNPIHIGVGTK